MSNAVCMSCGEWVHWRARRGTRLADIQCPKCKGKLRARTTADWEASKEREKQNAIWAEILEKS